MRDKDALDIFRLLQAVETRELAERLKLLCTSELSRSVTLEAIDQFRTMFADERSPGVAMARRLGNEVDAGDFISTSLVLLAQDLLHAFGEAS